MIEERVAALLAQLSASEQRMDDWRSRFARAYEVDKDEAIGGIYDRCMALETEVRQHLRTEIDRAYREMFLSQ